MLLLSTIHDPAGKLAAPALATLPLLDSIYEGVAFCVTARTHRNTIRALGASAILNTAEGAANGRRCALVLGLDMRAKVFHYCDGDRILYWALNNPDELQRVVKNYEHTKHLVILGRTPQAFRTHPFFQRITESIVNLSTFSGVDYLSGSRIIPYPLAAQILTQSKNNNAAALDLEWPKIAGGFIYAEVDGLAYEHRAFGLEKPFKQEIKTRLENMVFSIGAQWQSVK